MTNNRNLASHLSFGKRTLKKQEDKIIYEALIKAKDLEIKMLREQRNYFVILAYVGRHDIQVSENAACEDLITEALKENV